MSEYRINEVRDVDGEINSRNSPIKKSSDLPSVIIPAFTDSIKKEKVIVDPKILARPISAYGEGLKNVGFRPSTSQVPKNLNLKYPMRNTQARAIQNVSERIKITVAAKDSSSVKREYVSVQEINRPST